MHVRCRILHTGLLSKAFPPVSNGKYNTLHRVLPNTVVILAKRFASHLFYQKSEFKVSVKKNKKSHVVSVGLWLE